AASLVGNNDISGIAQSHKQVKQVAESGVNPRYARPSFQVDDGRAWILARAFHSKKNYSDQLSVWIVAILRNIKSAKINGNRFSRAGCFSLCLFNDNIAGLVLRGLFIPGKTLSSTE